MSSLTVFQRLGKLRLLYQLNNTFLVTIYQVYSGLNLFYFMEIFSWFFNNFVYKPQLNLLEFYFLLTKDIGFSIILVAITVNLILWPVMVSSYLSGIKMRLLATDVKAIQERFKTVPGEDTTLAMQKMGEMRKETGILYKKHNINTGVFVQVVVLQLFFASGVFYLVQDVSKHKQLDGLYDFIFHRTSTQFPAEAFWGSLDITKSSTSYIILPIASLILSYFYGRYSFQWAPNAKLPIPKLVKKEVKEGEKAEAPIIDPEALQKQQEFMIIYVLPIVSFLLNSSWSAGLNLYFAILSLFNLVRQVAISQYYASHVKQLIQDLAKSDPSSKDGDQDENNIKKYVDAEIVGRGSDTEVLK